MTPKRPINLSLCNISQDLSKNAKSPIYYNIFASTGGAQKQQKNHVTYQKCQWNWPAQNFLTRNYIYSGLHDKGL